MSGTSPILYPNVTSLPKQTSIESSGKASRSEKMVPGEFDRVFDQALELGQVRQPLKFSAHAVQRLNDRKISFDPETMGRINMAIDKAAAKGIEDSLVLTNGAALIVNVKNRTVITAMDKNSLSGNVFTNIDGAIIV